MTPVRRHLRRRRGPNKSAEERKDYLIQARVPRDLDEVLKQDAKRRRLSVSHLIRNVLQDTYKLVDGVMDEVDNLVQDSVELTDRVRRDARKIARSAAGFSGPAAAAAAREAPPQPGAATPPASQGDDLTRRSAADQPSLEALRAFEASTADIYAWNAVVLNRVAHCERCERELERGETAHLGLRPRPGARPRWLCSGCVAAL
jgi:hypothetical protein